MNLHPDIQKQVNRWKLRELEIEALSCEVIEHIEINSLLMPFDNTEGACYRDMELERLLHPEAWEDAGEEYEHIPGIIKQLED